MKFNTCAPSHCFLFFHVFHCASDSMVVYRWGCWGVVYTTIYNRGEHQGKNQRGQCLSVLPRENSLHHLENVILAVVLSSNSSLSPVAHTH